MAHSKRTHSPGGLHYLALRGNAGRQIFSQPSDASEFSALVAQHLESCRVRLFAFCWMPDAAYFAVEVSSVPLGEFVQRVAAQHARRINRRAGVRGHVFRQRYRVFALTEPQLPSVVCHLHLLPLGLGLSDPAEYPWSSHAVYLGLRTLPWVAMEPVLRLLESAGRTGVDAYRRLVEAETGQRLRSAQRRPPGQGDDGREVLALLRALDRPAACDRERLERLIESVAARLGVRARDVSSPSRRRILSLARAAIAWHATRSGIARLREVAYRLNRQSSTLSIGMEHHRARRPDLFGEPPEREEG